VTADREPARPAAERVESFEPVAAPDARVLILGSMPGIRSLRAGEYYAHPQNALWAILGAIAGFDPRAPYPVRTRRLRETGIALWDVLQSCRRVGSLDAAIDHRTAEPNDFGPFFAAHPRLRAVLCNGATAHDLFVRRVVPRLADDHGLEWARLPSTSPAHAAMSRADKLAAWRSALLPHMKA